MHPYLAALELLKDCVDYWRDYKEKLYFWFFPDYGICSNVERASCKVTGAKEAFGADFNVWVDKIIDTWPEASKSAAYPVDGFNNYQIEHINCTMWENEKRLRLLDYLIEKAKELE